jgi:PII-like signaling protein
MEFNGETKILRIFISSTDKFKNTPLYEVIVYAAKRYGMAGATVIRGVMGYGSSSAISSIKFWEISEKLPMIIEIVDESEKVERFFEIIKPYFEKIRYGSVITMEKANVIFYKTGTNKK